MMLYMILITLFALCNGSEMSDQAKGLSSEPVQFAMDWDRPKIVGGENADIRDAPYQVAMLYRIVSALPLYVQICGGSIIKSNVVVSAGHCASGTTPDKWRIRAGSTFNNFGGQVLDVSKVIVHPQYDSGTIDYDISIYILENDISIDEETTNLIPLPVQDAEVADDSPAFVTGWGSTREGGSTSFILQKVTIPIVNQGVCENSYSEFNNITARMICAGCYEEGGKDACQGDSGGPLAVDGVLIGITSWGKGCGRPGYPGVWARVPNLRNWIDEQLSSL